MLININLTVLHTFYLFFSYSICPSSSVFFSVVCNSVIVFKSNYEVSRITIQIFPIYKRFQCKFSIIPEKGWHGQPQNSSFLNKAILRFIGSCFSVVLLRLFLTGKDKKRQRCRFSYERKIKRISTPPGTVCEWRTKQLVDHKLKHIL